MLNYGGKIVDKIKELMEKRGNCLARAREILDGAKAENRDLNAEEKTNYEAAVNEATSLKAEADETKARHDAETDRFNAIEAAEREQADYQDWAKRANAAGAMGSAVRPDIDDGDRSNGPTDEDRMLAVQGWFENNSPEGRGATDEQVQAASRCNMQIRQGGDLVLNTSDHAGHVNMRRQYFNTLSTQIGSQGGFLAGVDSVTSIEVNMLHFNSIEQHAHVITTTHGRDFDWPTFDDTSNEGDQVGEGKAVDNEVDPDSGLRPMKAYKFRSGMIKVPYELIEDVSVLMQLLPGILGERLGRAKARKYTTGNGASTAEGILTGAKAGLTTAVANAIDPQEIVRLQYKVDLAYRNNPSAAYLCHDEMAPYFMSLTDGDNSRLWIPSMQVGAPDRLYGKPIVYNNYMDAPNSSTGVPVASKVHLLYGDLYAYKVRNVNQIRLKRLVERYGDEDKEGFVAFHRADGRLLNAGTAPIKKLTQKA